MRFIFFVMLVCVAIACTKVSTPVVEPDVPTVAAVDLAIEVTPVEPCVDVTLDVTPVAALGD